MVKSILPNQLPRFLEAASDMEQGAELAASIGEDTLTQAQKFQQAAREHGADDDEEAFKGMLRKLAKAKPSDASKL